MSAMVKIDRPISRIRSLTIENFRGYTGKHTLDCDADFVLVVGPNGYGKTGLIDALTLLLTGYNIHGDVEKLKSVYRKADGPVSVSAKCMTDEGKDCDLSILINDVPERSSTLPGESNINEELRTRLSIFYQDRVGLLFDREAKGLTLRDVLEPKPPEIGHIEQELEPVKEKLVEVAKGKDFRHELDAQDGDTNTLNAALVEAWRPVQEELQGIGDLMEDGWAPLTESVVTDPATILEAVEGIARKWLSGIGYPAAEIPGARLMEYFVDRLREALAAAIEAFRRRAAETSAAARDLQAELDAAKAEREGLERRFPMLDEDLVWAGGGAGNPDLLTLFRLLAQRTEVWRTPPPGSRDELRRIADEFARVVPLEAEKCAGILAGWLEPRRLANQRRQILDDCITNLDRDLKEARSSEAVRRLEAARESLTRGRRSLDTAWRNRWDRHVFDREQEGRTRANKFLIAAGEAAEGVRAFLDTAVPLSKPLREDLERRADTVLRRFSLVEGMIPLKLSAETVSRGDDRKSLTFAPTTGERGERGLDHFSTGQRAQVAVSLLLAQNQAVTSLLGHRVILLDDVSTAYDLSNLTRETIMWRQLAYGAGRPENARHRRQLFLCCHHEDMTSMVLDLMVPPAGRTMRMLSFKGWSMETGPEIEEMTVEPSADPDRLSGLAKALARF